MKKIITIGLIVLSSSIVQASSGSRLRMPEGFDVAKQRLYLNRFNEELARLKEDAAKQKKVGSANTSLGTAGSSQLAGASPTFSFGLGSKAGGQGTASASTNNNQGNSASSNSSGSNQQTGWSSYLTPRTFLVVGSLCVAAIIYRKNGSRAKDETDSKVVPVR